MKNKWSAGCTEANICIFLCKWNSRADRVPWTPKWATTAYRPNRINSTSDRSNLSIWLRLCAEVHAFRSMLHALQVKSFFVLRIHAFRYLKFYTYLMLSPHFYATFTEGPDWRPSAQSSSHLCANQLSLPPIPLILYTSVPVSGLILRTVGQSRPLI